MLIAPATDSDVSKRPKLEAHASTASSGTGSSATSLHGGDTPTGRLHTELSGSNTSQWHTVDGHTSPQSATMPKLALTLGASRGPGSPNTASPAVLPGYRDSIFGGTQQTLAWRDGQRDESGNSFQQLPRLASINDRRPSYPGGIVKDALNLTGSLQHAHRTGQSHPPPLLTSESTNRSSGSSASGASSAYYTPRTPMEPPLERALPIPSLYPQKSSGSFESQLPPLRPPSLSPQSTVLGTQQSPNGKFTASLPWSSWTCLVLFWLVLVTDDFTGIQTHADFPTSIPPIRSFTATASYQVGQGDRPHSRSRDFMSSDSVDDSNLDPVSALLRAGEIVNRNSRERSGS